MYRYMFVASLNTIFKSITNMEVHNNQYQIHIKKGHNVIIISNSSSHQGVTLTLFWAEEVLLAASF